MEGLRGFPILFMAGRFLFKKPKMFHTLLSAVKNILLSELAKRAFPLVLSQVPRHLGISTSARARTQAAPNMIALVVPIVTDTAPHVNNPARAPAPSSPHAVMARSVLGPEVTFEIRSIESRRHVRRLFALILFGNSGDVLILFRDSAVWGSFLPYEKWKVNSECIHFRALHIRRPSPRNYYSALRKSRRIKQEDGRKDGREIRYALLLLSPPPSCHSAMTTAAAAVMMMLHMRALVIASFLLMQ